MKSIKPTIAELGSATASIQAVGGSKVQQLVQDAGGPDLIWSTGMSYNIDE
ncbi:hypothetical protein [Terriglobus sp. TAA 43]|uniref:hypothetical protein n=1 Tax=Terriglobus sp. TAA 43 TaxID=278961 RepID=UPI0012EDB622|nr:hypothetical protein [Terriglobus sp. TAA 43]